jgi:hypothetical protein
MNETHTSIDSLLEKAAFFHKDNSKLQILLMLESLGDEKKFELLIEACRKNHVILDSMVGYLGRNFCRYILNHLEDDGELCQVLLGIKTWDFSPLNALVGSINFRRLLFQNADKVPKTLEHILQVAEDAEYYDIVIQLGSCFPKRRILSILLEQNDKTLIDKFFFLYKDYPEVKSLTPFI